MTLAVWYDTKRTSLWHGKYFSCRYERNTGEFGPGWGTLTLYRTFPLLCGSGSLMTFWAHEYTKDPYALTTGSPYLFQRS